MRQIALALERRELVADGRRTPLDLGVLGDRGGADRLAGFEIATDDEAEDALLALGEHALDSRIGVRWSIPTRFPTTFRAQLTTAPLTTSRARARRRCDSPRPMARPSPSPNSRGLTIVYAYPWTGRPGQPLLADDWDLDPRRARMHARDVRLSRPPRRPARRRRQRRLRPLDPGHRLPARARRAAPPAVLGSLRRRPRADPRARPADVRSGRRDPDQAPDARDPRRRDRARLVPGLPAGHPRGRGAGGPARRLRRSASCGS